MGNFRRRRMQTEIAGQPSGSDGSSQLHFDGFLIGVELGDFEAANLAGVERFGCGGRSWRTALPAGLKHVGERGEVGFGGGL